MTKVIAIGNQKGGVGKSTVTFTLGAGLARAGKRVAVLDFDPQANLTLAMGFDSPDTIPVTVSDKLYAIMRKEEVYPEEGFLEHEEGLFLMPSSIELSEVEASITAKNAGREYVLKRYINMIRDDFEYILIDTNPALNQLSINALAASDSIIIPTQPQYFSAKGMEQLFETYNQVKEFINPQLEIMGVLINMIDARQRFPRDFAELIREAYGEHIHIFNTQIPTSVRMAECASKGISIFRHDPDGKAAKAFEEFIQEVERIGDEKHRE
jgi:chromosome partitioning protein